MLNNPYEIDLDDRRRHIERDLNVLGRRLEELRDPDVEPLDIVEAAHAMNQVIEQLLRMTVANASDAGHSWAEIGMVLDTDRETAREMYGP